MTTQVALGTFLDRHTLRFELVYPHPVERVWSALTDTEQLALWFMPVELDARLGGRFVLTRDDGPQRGAGVITAYEPGHLLEVTFDEGESHFGPGCVVRFEVSADRDRSRVTFTHRLSPDVVYPMPGQMAGPGTFPPGTAAGWHGFTDGLARLLDGRVAPIYDDSDDIVMSEREEVYRKVITAQLRDHR